MNSQVLECIEPHGRPARRMIQVVTDEEVAVYALELSPDLPPGLRRTTLRRQDQHPPAHARMVMWVRVDSQGGLVVIDIGKSSTIELVRGEARSQVVAGIRLPAGNILELTLPDQSRISFSLSLHRQAARGTAVGIAGSGTRSSRVRYAADNVWWLITDSKGIFVTIGINFVNAARNRLRAMGVDSRVIAFVSGTLLTAAVGAGAAYYQHTLATSATERADEAEDALALARAAQASALATEMACLEQRKDLVAELGQASQQDATAVEIAMVFALANRVAVEYGGTRMATPEVQGADNQYRPGLVQAVMSRMNMSTGDPKPCLDQAPALGNELPNFLLLWHSDPSLTCPLDYVSEVGGVRQVGRWGLSDRVSLFFGAAGEASTGVSDDELEELLGDRRFEDRWSAFTMVLAYRDVLETVIGTTKTERPATYPSQALLWPLALLDAYNRMPSPGEGALDLAPKECIDKLLQGVVQSAPPARPGEPLLPDLAAVAAEDVVVPVVPTPGCQWTKTALRDGADAALTAVARLASTGGGESE